MYYSLIFFYSFSFILKVYSCFHYVPLLKNIAVMRPAFHNGITTSYLGKSRLYYIFIVLGDFPPFLVRDRKARSASKLPTSGHGCAYTERARDGAARLTAAAERVGEKDHRLRGSRASPRDES